MRVFFTFCLLLICSSIFCQDTVYLNKTHNRVDKNQAEYYRVIYKGTKIPELVIKETYFITGNKESDTYTIYDQENKTEDSISFHYVKTWYKNGNIKSVICEKYGSFSDTLKTYWENGSLKRKDFYKEGKLINGQCYDSLGLEIKHFDYYIRPQYPGGENNLLATIEVKVQLPKFIRDNGLKIKIIVRFAVDVSGNVTKIYILKGYNKEVDDAAINGISQLKKFKPALVDGVPTEFYYMVPITLGADN